jgi:hypothetical protein
MARWILCFFFVGCGGGSSQGAPDAAPPVFPTGVYTCQSSLEVTGTYQSEQFESVGGGNGTLTLTQSGVVVTAAYTGDTFLNGTLQFDATTGGSAEPIAGDQILSVTCFAPFPQVATQPQPLSLASGSLTADGTTVFLSFSGTAEPSGTPTACDGLRVPGTLTCTTQP